MPSNFKLMFPTLQPLTTDCIEVVDPVLKHLALRWSMTIMLDSSVFEFVPLWKTTPIGVRFSNLQLWAMKKVFPESMCQSPSVRHGIFTLSVARNVGEYLAIRGPEPDPGMLTTQKPGC